MYQFIFKVVNFLITFSDCLNITFLSNYSLDSSLTSMDLWYIWTIFYECFLCNCSVLFI